MNDWLIGTVEFVNQKIIEFSTSITDLGAHIDDGHILETQGLNDFVYTKLTFEEYAIFKVIKIRNSLYDKNNEQNSIPQYNKIIITAVPIGVLDSKKFTPGFIHYPMVGQNVYGMSPTEVQKLFNNYKNTISIGKLNNYEEVEPKINLDSIFTNHWAILGNTGSGKSTTLRKILTKIHEQKAKLKKNVRFYVLDLHGDYSQLGFGENVDIKDMHIPLENLTSEDWEAALLPSDRTQKPLLDRILKIAQVDSDYYKYIYACLALKAISDSSQDSFVMLRRNVQKLIELISDPKLNDSFKKWHVEYSDECNRDKLIERLNTYLSQYEDTNISVSVDQIIETQKCNTFTIDDMDRSFEIAVIEEEISGNRNIRQNIQTMYSRFQNLKMKYKDDLLGNNGEEISINSLKKKDNFIILNLCNLDDDALRLVSNYLVRSLFNLHTQIELRNKEKKFSYIFLDEAHRYIKESPSLETTIFDRVAREGRKFNLYLCILSQIPSELSRVVLSQCGVYFIHRIQNANDLEFIAHNVPSASQDILDRLKSLPAGVTIVSGSAIDFPIEISVDAKELSKISASESPFK